jgi:hypothetical protein
VADTTSLTRAVDHFADRLRAAPQSRLQRSAAAQALGLARELAAWAQRIEEPGVEPREMPDVGMFAGVPCSWRVDARDRAGRMASDHKTVIPIAE